MKIKTDRVLFRDEVVDYTVDYTETLLENLSKSTGNLLTQENTGKTK